MVDKLRTLSEHLLLLATLVVLALSLAAHHLSKHHDAVAIHKSNPGQTLAVLT